MFDSLTTFLYFFTSFVKFVMVASLVKSLVLPDCYLSNKLTVSSYEVDKFYVFEGVDHETVGDTHLALKSENYILLATKDTELFFVGLS